MLPKFKFRGRTSINAGNKPLYGCDGVVLPTNNSKTQVLPVKVFLPNSEAIVSLEILVENVMIVTKGNRKFKK